MPEDKKNQHKGKSDAKEQRKPRQGRQKSGPHKTPDPASVEKKAEATKAPQQPVYEDPGPEFYKNLKRETDEILKITEEANSKYKKKEIQSNWSKYEMPVESYEDIEEQENLGADYEKLIQMPMSVGGHFQFKHEKSWDMSTGPSLYDKYFEINMNNLANALETIPFYERNEIEKDIFSETDILAMDHRAIKYKQKYYNDKSYTTPELEARDKILNSYKEAFSSTAPDDINSNVDSIEENNDIITQEPPAASSVTDNCEIDLQLENNKIDSEMRTAAQAGSQRQKVVEVIDKIILEESSSPGQEKISASCNEAKSNAVSSSLISNDISIEKETSDKRSSKPEESKTPVIESPEDLEKWLDDFLDG